MPPSRTKSSHEEDFIEAGVRLRDALQRDQSEFDALVRDSGLKHRKAYYLVNVAEAFERSSVPRSDLLALGWTKVEMLKDRANDPALSALVSRARELPVPELRRLLDGREPRENRHVVSLNLTSDQFEIFAAALVAHGAIRTGRSIAGREEALTKALQTVLAQRSRS